MIPPPARLRPILPVSVVLAALFCLAPDNSLAQFTLEMNPTNLTSGETFSTDLSGGQAGSLPLLFFGSELAEFGLIIPLDIVPLGFWVLPPFASSGGFTFNHDTPDDISDLCDVTMYVQAVAMVPLQPFGFAFEPSNVVDLSFDCTGCADQSSGNNKPAFLLMEYTGEDCTATTHSQDPNAVICSGDPRMEPSVRILATDRSNPDSPNANIWFDGVVALNGQYEIDAAAIGEPILRGETYVFVFDLSDNLLQTVAFHTSCSEPLDVNNQFGAHKVLGVQSED
jgi:hypothetical protein